MNTKLISFMLVLGMIFSGIVLIIPNQTSATWSGSSYYWDDESGIDDLASTASNWYEMNGEIKTSDVVPTENNAIYCYIDSTPNTTLTAGDMYYYHPVVVCNGTYTLGMNKNGALVVSNETGNVTGSPIAGVYDIEMYVTDSDGNIAYQNWTLTVFPFTNKWTNDRVVDIALLVIIMGLITLFNYLGYVKGLFLLQILSFMIFLFVLVPLWPGNEMGGLLVLVFGIGNIGLLIGGLKK